MAERRDPAPYDALNTKILSDELSTVSDWYQLGIKLGVPDYKLHEIQTSYPTEGCSRWRVESLSFWLRSTPNSSWESVVRALQMMGENTLAEMIQWKYIKRQSTPTSRITGHPTAPRVISPTQQAGSQNSVVPAAHQIHSVQPVEDSGAVAIARENRQKINGKFGVLLMNSCKKLRENHLNVKDFRLFLKGLFPPGDCVPESSNVDEIFEAITHNKLWNYWNCSPLQKVVQQFVGDDQEMKTWIETYKKDLISYKATMRLVDYITVVDSDTCSDDLTSDEEQEQAPAKYDRRYYRKLSIKLEAKFTSHTLEYLDDLWKEFADLYNLPPLVTLLDCVRKRSILIVWLIPAHLAHHILRSAPGSVDIFRKHQITRVEFDGVCIYPEAKQHSEGISLEASVPVEPEAADSPPDIGLAARRPLHPQVGHPTKYSVSDVKRRHSSSTSTHQDEDSASSVAVSGTEPVDSGFSEGYCTYHYCSAFTQQERKQFKRLFGRDLFGKGYSGKDLSEEQVQRILTRISPLLRQSLKTKDILPFLKQRALLTEAETLHLKSGSLRPEEQSVKLVEFLLNKGSCGIGALYLFLIESSEHLSGLSAHYQLAGELKQIVQAECGVGSMVVPGATGGYDDEPLQCKRDGISLEASVPVEPEAPDSPPDIGLAARRPLHPQVGHPTKYSASDVKRRHSSSTSTHQDEDSARSVAVSGTEPVDSGFSEDYCTYHYCSAFTQQERKQFKRLFGRDLFGKGYSGKDLSEEQVQRILTRISPLLRQSLKTKDILPFLKQRALLTEAETLHLKSGSLRPEEQSVKLVEFLLNKGSCGIGALYLFLIESSEHLSGLSAHYQLAGELKQIVQAECGVGSMVVPGATGGYDDEPLQCKRDALQLVVENLHGIAVPPETGKAFVANLGFSEEEFPSIPGDLLSICHIWMDRQSACYVLELVEALVCTRGLGRFTTRLCDHRNTALLEIRYFFLSLGDKWQDIAEYLGFSAEEIHGIVSPHPDNTEMQVTEFFHLWQLPDCGQRILPLMHQLKSLTGIVEMKNPSRRFDDRPVQAECGVGSMVVPGATGGYDDEPLQSLQLVVENLHGIAVPPETGKAFVANLGFSEEEFPSIPGDLLSICHIWMDRQSACYVLELVEALVCTRGLGRFTTRLCDHRNSALLEIRYFFLSLGDKWQDIAEYLGFSAEEIQGIVSLHPDNTEMQVTEFFHLWQLPDCGQRILPLMHQLKSLTGIVESKNPSRRFDDRPGTLGYKNRHLKTDISGNPHRSLDTYAHSSPPRSRASGYSSPSSSSFRQPAHPKPMSADSGHSHQRTWVRTQHSVLGRTLASCPKDSYLTPLLVCCFAGEKTFEAACHLITRGASVNGSPKARTKPLITASEEGHVKMVELLLANGADANLTDQDGNTALLRACLGNHPDVAKRLLQGRSAVNVNTANSEGLTPLMVAVTNTNLELVGILVSHGADVNCSREGLTPLMVAVTNTNLELVGILVSHGADVNCSREALTPLMVAVTNANLEPPPAVATQSSQEEPLNDFSDEALCQFENERFPQQQLPQQQLPQQQLPQQQLPQQQLQHAETQPQTVLNNFEEPAIGNGTTSVQNPVPWQQTPAGSQSPWQQIPAWSQTNQSPLNQTSQGTPQQVDFVQKPQPKDLPQSLHTDSASLQTSEQCGPPMLLRQAADVVRMQTGNGAATGGAETSSAEVDKSLFEPRPRSLPLAVSPEHQPHPAPLLVAFPGSEHLPWTSAGLMDKLFNQHFAIGSAFPDPSSLSPPTPPPPQPLHQQSKLSFPETGGLGLGRGEDEKPREPTPHPVASRKDHSASGSQISAQAPMSNMIVQDTPVPIPTPVALTSLADSTSQPLHQQSKLSFPETGGLGLGRGEDEKPREPTPHPVASREEHSASGSQISAQAPMSNVIVQDTPVPIPTPVALTSLADSTGVNALSVLNDQEPALTQTSSKTPPKVSRNVQKLPPTTAPPASHTPPVLTNTAPTQSGTKSTSSQMHGKEPMHPVTRPPPSMPTRDVSPGEVVVKPLPTTGTRGRTVSSKANTTKPKWYPDNKTSASSREKRASLTSSETGLEERLTHRSSQWSSQYCSVSKDVPEILKNIDPLKFTHEQVPGPEKSKAVALLISKWKILGRYLGLDDDTLDAICQESNFSEMLVAMFRAKATKATTAGSKLYPDNKTSTHEQVPGPEKSEAVALFISKCKILGQYLGLIDDTLDAICQENHFSEMLDAMFRAKATEATTAGPKLYPNNKTSTHEQVPGPEKSKAVALLISKWKILGRNLGLDDDTLDAICRENHFSFEKMLVAMFRAKATKATTAGSKWYPDYKTSTHEQVPGPEKSELFKAVAPHIIKWGIHDRNLGLDNDAICQQNHFSIAPFFTQLRTNLG